MLINRFNKIFIISAISLFLVASSGSQALGYGAPPAQSSANNYTVEIYTDQESYNLGESITFSGSVNKYDENRNLRISIFDSNNNFILTKKTSVNTDATFSYNIVLNEKFHDGKYIVRAQYGNSKVTVETMSFVINSNGAIPIEQKLPTSAKIPNWIKSNAGWWADGLIDDNSFVQGIQFLIKEGLMKIPATIQGSVSQDNQIPDWIKSNAGWWADGLIDDNSFVQGIQFLIKEGLMKISN
ncbi:MAG: hypothetical protein IIA82_09355 [Thaumarchaeota archaeon]|nr:hypothetical protein [Nitrososphaerota archaeon]